VDQTVLIRKLQDLDLELMRTRKRLDEMPEKLAILQMRRKVAEFGALRSRAQAAHDAIDSSVKKHEGETELLEQKMADEQAKLLSGDVTNPKEVANISRELDALRRQKEKLDNDTLAEMEKRENAAEQVGKVEAAIEEGKRREAVLTADFQEKGSAITAEISQLEAERKVVAAALAPELLGQYERLRETKHGIGLGVLHDNTCTACRVELPAVKVAALRGGEPIGVCPACHRLLVVTPKEDEE
jgi:predicted  nucleic acid-binding Zn-ribbon protein